MTFKVQRRHGVIRKSINLRRYVIDWAAPSRSKFQTQVKQFLYPFWGSFFVYEEVPVAGTKMTLDFFCSTMAMAIEVQGKQHQKVVAHFHGEGIGGYSNWLDQAKRDQAKEEFCELNGITLIEIFPEDKLDKGLAKKLGLI